MRRNKFAKKSLNDSRGKYFIHFDKENIIYNSKANFAISQAP